MARPFAVGCYLPQHVPVARLVGWARAAEAAALHGLWVPDHLHQFPDKREGRLEAWSLLAALAAETSRIRLGLGVCNVQVHQPALVAKMAFTLDRLSGGRLDLALGAGGNRAELAAYGLGPRTGAAARARLRDTILTVRALEGGGPAAGPDGPSASLERTYCRPTPVQRPFPLTVAADHPDTLRLAARYADRWYANLCAPDDFGDRNARFTALAKAEGRDPAAVGRLAHVSIIVGRTAADAAAAAVRYARGPRARLFEVPQLVGDAGTVAEGLAAYRRAGADGANAYLLNLLWSDGDEGGAAIEILGSAAAMLA